jgi:hypothetical protein
MKAAGTRRRSAAMLWQTFSILPLRSSMARVGRILK